MLLRQFEARVDGQRQVEIGNGLAGYELGHGVSFTRPMGESPPVFPYFFLRPWWRMFPGRPRWPCACDCRGAPLPLPPAGPLRGPFFW